jgi:hypothetical protein
MLIFKPITDLISKLIELAQERNTLALGSLSELKDANNILREIEKDGDAAAVEQKNQTKILQSIADSLITPPSVPAKLVITLGTQVPQ